jgi:hypothetical protein
MALSKVDPNFLNVSQVGGRRNLVINGAMQVAQRGTSSTSSGYQTVDRISLSIAGSQIAFTQSQAADGPAGFTKSYKFTVTTPETTLDSSDVIYLKHAVEDNNLQHLSFGTSGAKTFTISFWVKSSVTGDYPFTIYQQDGNKGYNVVYTINSANTWEYKTITISGNTADVINADGGLGFDLYFCLSSGTTYTSNSSLRDNWAAYTSAGFAYGQTANLMTTNGATWQFTGLQLEVGDTATPFEHRSYGEELSLCERYYVKHSLDAYQRYDSAAHADTTSRVWSTPSLPTTMRTTPTISQTGLTVDGEAVVSIGSSGSGNQRLSFVFNHGSSRSTGAQYQVYSIGSGTVTYSSEL